MDIDQASNSNIDEQQQEPIAPEIGMIPEYLIEDAIDALVMVTRIHPEILLQVQVGDFMTFIVVMMSSPKYLRNVFIKGRLMEVIHHWLPQDNQQQDNNFPGRRQRFIRPNDVIGNQTRHLFVSDPVVQNTLVRSLLNLYIDIEYTDRHNQFYEKFSTRCSISEVLQYLWEVPQHQMAWRHIALEDRGRGLNLRYANMVINDSIFMLDELLKKLPEIREIERRQNNPQEWSQLNSDEQSEQISQLQKSKQTCRVFSQSAREYIKTMQITLTSSDLRSTYLLPEMVDRLAGMLNYFLEIMVNPEKRGHLKVSNQEDLNFNPKSLLTLLVSIYCLVSKDDKDLLFAKSIAEDERSYKPEYFLEAKNILLKLVNKLDCPPELSPMLLDDWDQLIKNVNKAKSLAGEEERIMASSEVPDEFLDPITYTFMHDPVQMPSSKLAIDRKTILRHLLTDERDPINRAPLKKEELIEIPELKEKVLKWYNENVRQKAMLS